MTMQDQKPLMPKGTAVWLIDNTALTFDQISKFCKIHPLEIKALADHEGPGVPPQNPINEKLLTKEEIARCEADPKAELKAEKTTLPQPKSRSKGPRYTPVSKRGDKPDAIAWLLKQHPELKDSQIVKLIGTTKKTIESIREKSHANITNIKPRSPVDLGLCTYEELHNAVDKIRKQLEKEGKTFTTPAESYEAEQEEEETTPRGGFDFSSFLSDSSTGTDG